MVIVKITESNPTTFSDGGDIVFCRNGENAVSWFIKSKDVLRHVQEVKLGKMGSDGIPINF